MICKLADSLVQGIYNHCTGPGPITNVSQLETRDGEEWKHCKETKKDLKLNELNIDMFMV